MKSQRMKLSPWVLAASGMLASVSVADAATLAELIATVPAPPKDMATAVSWVRDGQIVEPAYLSFKHQLDAERASVIALNGGTPPLLGSAPSPNIPDAPEVQNAIRGYDQYLDAHSGRNDPKTALAKRTRWLQAAMGQSLATLLEKLKPCSYPCQDPTIVAANAPLEAKKQDMVEHDLRAIGTRLVHHLLHVFVLDPEGPVGDEVARVRNGRIGERLPDDATPDPSVSQIWCWDRAANCWRATWPRSPRPRGSFTTSRSPAASAAACSCAWPTATRTRSGSRPWC